MLELFAGIGEISASAFEPTRQLNRGGVITPNPV
jgi:hypothetical protein